MDFQSDNAVTATSHFHTGLRPVLPHHFLHSFLLLSWRAVRSYRPHLDERDPIWGNDWSHSPFIRRSPSWDFLEFSSAVRQMPRDLCTTPRIISLSPFSLATDVTDATLGASGSWLGTRTGAGGTATLGWSFFGRSPWLHGEQEYQMQTTSWAFSHLELFIFIAYFSPSSHSQVVFSFL